MMTELPDTRESLLLRVSDPSNAEAWREFAAIYRPAVYRMARRRGLQDADAEDLSQRVLVAISQKIAEWRPTSPQGAFRAWVSVIARNLALNALTRTRVDSGKGGTSVIERLARQPAREEGGREQSDNEFDDEYRRALFRRASEQIRGEFQEATWQAFWLTAVEGLPIAEAARRLGKSEGVIYAGRSRVMRRLKQKVREFELPLAESSTSDNRAGPSAGAD
jgi:RNA polymerase sigma-70 factor (ECF subfamily)